jgi:hypothetical protein
MKRLTLWSGILLCLIQLNLHAQNWQNLIGKNLKIWQQLGGTAKYELIDGMIVGTSVANSKNSFLITKQTYGDFILEFEVWVDPVMNSGVQIRSLSRKDYMNGRVHGYQVELDPTPRAFSGGLYDEARRKWLYPLSRNEKGRKAFKNGEWNSIHIEAIGNQIQTWVNGVQCVNLIDDMTSEGFIGLQVHEIYNDDHIGKQVKWRNMRILTSDFDKARIASDPDVTQISYLINQLTEKEKATGWKLLWDGKTSSGWRGAKLDGFPESGWNMKDGVLSVIETEGKESEGPGDIITIDQYSDFELELEFKITKGANSGIKYFVDPDLNRSTGSAIGCEFQILDDEVHPDAKMGVAGNRTIGSLYDLITAKNQTISGRSKQFKGIGEWNQARIVSKDGWVEHWLNNEKVVSYDRNSQMFENLVSKSKYSKWDNFGQWPKGHILLQDHGNAVSFRSIKIKEL